METYKMRKFNADKLGNVKKVKLITDDEKSEDAIDTITKNIDKMGKSYKSKKLKFDL